MAETDSTATSLSRRDCDARREFWSCLALRWSRGIGARRSAALLAYFGSAYEAVRAVSSWRNKGIPQSCITEYNREQWRQQALLEWTAAKNSSCGILLWTDAAYPAWLRSIVDAPMYLYTSGDTTLLNTIAVAVVGMRKCSQEGLTAAVQIARGISASGVTVVSGMAMGIDRAAHLAGLEGPGGSIGVLGAGVDVDYPVTNSDLYELMRRKGLLLSEYPPGCRPEAGYFPVRNRIVSGLSRAVVVVEAAMRSGSLNTASHALEQNRDLMAVPGPASASSAKGCQELVRRGAKPVFCADDVLREIVPHLTEHIRKTVMERDLARFRYRGKTEDRAADAVDSSELLTDSHSHDNVPWVAVKSGKTPDQAKRHCLSAERKSGPQAEGTHVPLFEEDVMHERPPNLTDQEGVVWEFLRGGPAHIDDICRSLRQGAGEVSRTLTLLEMNGSVKRLAGMIYSLP